MNKSLMIKLGLINLAGGMLMALATVEAGAGESIQAVSVAAQGQPQSIGGNGDSTASTISADGRFVLFLSWANNLVTNDGNGLFIDVFLRDRTNGTTVLASENLAGTGGGNGHSLYPSVSVDSRYVAFSSAASNLVSNDNNGVTDVFVRDLLTGTTTLVSANQAEIGGGNGASTEPVMTPDGRYVAFVSDASDLAADDTNGVSDVFIRDRQTGITTRVSEGTVPPYPGSGGVNSPAITPDGRFVAFVRSSTNLVPGITKSMADVYVKDRQTGLTSWAGTNVVAIMQGVTNSVAPISAFNPVLSDDGHYLAFKAVGPANLILRHDLQSGFTDLVTTGAIGGVPSVGDSSGPEMTPDGRFIAFAAQTNATDSVQVYRWDAQAGASTLASVSVSGEASANGFADTPAISADGRFVTFLSDAADLVAGVNDGSIQVYVRDLVLGVTRLVSADTADGVSGEVDVAIPTISADGRFIAFDSFDGGYVANDSNNASDVFVRDTAAESTELVSRAVGGLVSATANAMSSLYANAADANGRFVVFASVASDLVANDTNGVGDVFVRDLQTGSNVLVSASSDGGGGNRLSSVPAISRDGHHVVFVSSATNLVDADRNGQPDVFVRDLLTGTTELVSQNMGFTGNDSASSNGESSSPVISGDGQFVAFLSSATNLAPSVLRAILNVYWRDRTTGTTVALTTNLFGASGIPPAMSSDGRIIVCCFNAVSTRAPSLYVRDMFSQTNLVNGEVVGVVSYSLSPDGRVVVFQTSTNPGWPITALDLQSHTHRIVGYSASAAGPGPKPALSSDGRLVAFVSSFNSPEAPAGAQQIFLHDRQTATTVLASMNTNRTGGGNANSDSPALSGDGRFLAFRSFASDLVANDNNGWPDVFVFDRLTGVTRLVSENRNSTGGGNGISAGPVVAAAGSRIIFRSVASDLVNEDLNDTQDVFYFAISVPAPVDSDADGMEDNWERSHFGDSSHDGTADSDGDGTSDLAEFRAGTDPSDPSSVLGIRIVNRTPDGSTLLSWPAAPARGYRAQFKNDLHEPSWIDFPGWVSVTGDTASIVDPAPSSSGDRFYRILLVE